VSGRISAAAEAAEAADNKIKKQNRRSEAPIDVFASSF